MRLTLLGMLQLKETTEFEEKKQDYTKCSSMKTFN